MELKPGYKLTDISAIPESWGVACVDAIARVTTGSKNTQDRTNDGQYPFFVRSQTVERINSYSFDGEAVLTAGDGVGTGKVFHYIKGKFDAHQRVYRIAEFNPLVSGYFFFLYFSTHFYTRIMQMTAKSSVDSVRMEMIARMLIPIPPRDEQDAIADAIRHMDALIAVQDRLLAKKCKLKQGAMQDLVTGRRRLPGHTGKWEVRPLAQVITICHGKSQREVAATDGAYPILASGGEIGRAKHWLYDKPSVLIGRKGTIDQPRYTDTPFWAVDTLFYSVVHKSNNAKFVYYCFCLIEWRKHNEASGVPSLNARTIEAIEIGVPELQEQTAIAAILSDMDRDIASMEARMAKLRALRKGMMQELLTGRIRLV